MTSEDTFETWVKDYGNMVRSLCGKVIRNRDAALDASQSTWELVYKNKDSFRNESSAGTWIYKIAYREALRVSKKNKGPRYKDLIRDYHAASIQTPVDQTEMSANVTYDWLSSTCDMCLSGIIGTLTFNTRIIVVFKYILGIPFEEIAAILDIEQSAVRQAASRGKRRLKDFFENECGLYMNRSYCQCGLAGQLADSSFKKDVLALKAITDKARFLHETGNQLPPIDYWKTIRDNCHKKGLASL